MNTIPVYVGFYQWGALGGWYTVESVTYKGHTARPDPGLVKLADFFKRIRLPQMIELLVAVHYWPSYKQMYHFKSFTFPAQPYLTYHQFGDYVLVPSNSGYPRVELRTIVELRLTNTRLVNVVTSPGPQ
jgi:hypothetical protein